MNDKILFQLGRVVATPAALALAEDQAADLHGLLARHQRGDWGDVPPEDARENKLSVREGYRIQSSYQVAPGERIWVITEGDRSVTTILLPADY
jgi:hypothetical protein